LAASELLDVTQLFKGASFRWRVPISMVYLLTVAAGYTPLSSAGG
jgi:hypothetical protein